MRAFIDCMYQCSLVFCTVVDNGLFPFFGDFERLLIPDHRPKLASC